MYHDYVLVSLIFQNWSKFVIFLYEVKSDLGIVNSGEVNQTTMRDAVVALRRRLARRPQPLAVVLPLQPQPGHREQRHRFSCRKRQRSCRGGS